MISPDPQNEDGKKNLDLWAITQQTILQLEKRLGKKLQFLAAEHDNQTDIRHVHCIVLVSGRLNVADLLALQQAATEASVPTRQPARSRATGA